MIRVDLLRGASKNIPAARRTVNLGVVTTAKLGVLGAALWRRARDTFAIAAVVGVFAGAGTVGYLHASQAARETALSERRDRAVRDSTRYAKVLSGRARTEAVRDTIRRQINIIKSIDRDRYIWPHVMIEVSRALPRYTWLTALAFTGTPQGQPNVVAAAKDTANKGAKRPKRLETKVPSDDVFVRLQGRTVDIQALTQFMTDLEASPFFSNVQLDHSELALEQGKEVTQFQLTLAYVRPDTTRLAAARSLSR
jgi:Tfp pilus assembly protein PilN